MSCSPFDLRDYLFGELADADRRQVDLHLKSCSGCHEDLERLRVMHAALLALRDEEIPQRIGFVSDRVFEPSRARRAWQAFWGSAPRLGFASAAMLSAALVILAFFRPAPAVQVLDTAVLEQRVSQRVAAAVQKAVAETETRQAQKTAELLAAAERRFSAQRQEDLQSVAQALEVLQKRANVRETMLAWNRQGEMK